MAYADLLNRFPLFVNQASHGSHTGFPQEPNPYGTSHKPARQKAVARQWSTHKKWGCAEILFSEIPVH